MKIRLIFRNGQADYNGCFCGYIYCEHVVDIPDDSQVLSGEYKPEIIAGIWLEKEINLISKDIDTYSKYDPDTEIIKAFLTSINVSVNHIPHKNTVTKWLECLREKPPNMRTTPRQEIASNMIKIIKIRHGIDEEFKTFKQISKDIGISKTRASQILNKGERMLRHPWRQERLKLLINQEQKYKE